ncbi:MAG: hypothetical protein ACI8QC_002662 [Planctomycetota bacterium]|jgi:hypothetical protein
MKAILLAGASLLLSCSASAMPVQDPAKAPIEYGTVKWERRLEPALARAAKSSKPVVLCFQEVPG